MTLNRRQVIKGAAWSVPIIALSASTPLAAASTEPTPTPRIPISCEKAGTHHWYVSYNDGTTVLYHQGEVNSDKTLQALCRGKGPQS